MKKMRIATKHQTVDHSQDEEQARELQRREDEEAKREAGAGGAVRDRRREEDAKRREEKELKAAVSKWTHDDSSLNPCAHGCRLSSHCEKHASRRHVLCLRRR